jgi:ssRNA-specific RNase YbeY (16S rRNA maturation enzyme)
MKSSLRPFKFVLAAALLQVAASTQKFSEPYSDLAPEGEIKNEIKSEIKSGIKKEYTDAEDYDMSEMHAPVNIYDHQAFEDYAMPPSGAYGGAYDAVPPRKKCRERPVLDTVPQVEYVPEYQHDDHTTDVAAVTSMPIAEYNPEYQHDDYTTDLASVTSMPIAEYNPEYQHDDYTTDLASVTSTPTPEYDPEYQHDDYPTDVAAITSMPIAEYNPEYQHDDYTTDLASVDPTPDHDIYSSNAIRLGNLGFLTILGFFL